MPSLYTTEKNVLILIALLKANKIKNVIASPGTTNCAFIGSIQKDPFFKIYSAVDERSAAYMACGLAAETGEPVVISCTGATASRNYLPGLTEAFYRKLPVLAVTSMQAFSKVGHHVAQVIDRSVIQNDVAKHSVALPVVKDHDDYWECEVKINTAILELTRHGGGPVHINLPTNYELPFSTKELPSPRVMQRFTSHVQLPALQGKVAVLVGSHKTWQTHEVEALEAFCAAYNAVVFCDHTSGYHGQYRVQFSLAAAQELLATNAYKPDVLIHIGEITGDYPLLSMVGKQVWRVNEDGEIRDTFRRLTNVFEMPEYVFFSRYAKQTSATPVANSYLVDCQSILSQVRSKIPQELPFSNIWLASKLAPKLPANSVIHFGILNSLRTWNFFDLPANVSSASNVGGFGIDGILSTIIGASLVNPERLYFTVLGDLAFFYDMNAIGNRHVGNNVRILMVNNGKGTEFRQYNHHASYFGDAADEFVAAAGHYGNKSPTLVKHYAENLGFEYLSAKNKTEFEQVYQRFINAKPTNKPMVFEVFTDSQDESDALAMMHRLEQSQSSKAKQITKKLLGKRGIRILKKLLRS
ncbi:thiamine pyrophosphate-binding protein [Aeromonas enteropelogenes]|uniref:thiamine pyrophosphate-binding protein n=1 Tax=Aeromonas enteropelogenes TaxID=29489 RepID=UPI003B9FFE12